LKKRNHEKLILSPRSFLKRIVTLVTQPLFITLASVGNSIILAGAAVLYLIEGASNPKIHSFLDTLWWSVATVTTVGYGDVSPVTTAGKWVGIFMMLLGTTLFCSFTALFAATLLSSEFHEVEQNVKDIENSVDDFRREVRADEEIMDQHLSQIEIALQELKAMRKSRSKSNEGQRGEGERKKA